MDSAAVKLATTAYKYKYRKDGQKFLTAALETSKGVDVSVDSEELAGHVDEQFDGHADGGKAIVEGFKKVILCCCCWCCCCRFGLYPVL